MVRLKFVLLCSAFALLLSCSGGGRAELSYSEDSFKEGRLEKLRTYDCEPLGVLNPAVVKHHPSGAILLLERGVKSQLKVIDPVDGSVESLLPTGRGPGEAVTPWDLSVDAAGTLWVSDLATRKLISFAIGSDGSFRFDGERKLQSQFMRAMPFRDEETLILASSSSGNRMCVLDAAGAAVDTVGSFPYSDLLDKSVLRNSMFQSDLAVAHDGGVIVCCKSFNVIDVYAPDLLECRRLVGPEPIDVGVVARETPMGMMYAQKPFVKVFDGVAAGTGEFMVGYVGAYTEGSVAASEGAVKLLLFDRKGRPSKVFETPGPFRSFDVDWQNRNVYILTSDEAARVEVYGFN